MILRLPSYFSLQVWSNLLAFLNHEALHAEWGSALVVVFPHWLLRCVVFFTQGFLALKSGWEIFAVFRCSVLRDVLLDVLSSLVWANMSAFLLPVCRSARLPEQIRSGVCWLGVICCLVLPFVDVFFLCTYIISALPFLPLFLFFFIFFFPNKMSLRGAVVILGGKDAV